MSLVIKSLHKRFGTYSALQDIGFTAPVGAFTSVLGPSGSGKTTLLRILGGLEFPDHGEIHLGDMDWLAIPARERRVGFVFQNYALFRHMTVAQNVAFGLSVRPRRERPSRAEIIQRVEGLLSMVRLDGFGSRYPSQLSGGQRQRAALARALAIEPSMLLLDEPFGALDAKIRKELSDWLRGLQKALAITTVFVTHDQDEAFALADLIVVINGGRIEQYGSPDEVRRNPNTPFVRAFLDPRA